MQAIQLDKNHAKRKILERLYQTNQITKSSYEKALQLLESQAEERTDSNSFFKNV